jgi:ADP-heptose:LPS heptosyltransferase
MATPAIRRLREMRPDVELHAVALRQPCYELLDGLETVDKAHYLPYWEGKHLQTVLGALKLRGTFDETFLAFPSVRREYHLVALALGARRRVAHHYEPSFTTLSFLETDRVPILSEQHNVVNNLRLLGDDGIDAAPPKIHYDIPATWKGSHSRDRVVAFHVGTMTHKGNENKRWPLERFITVANSVRESGFDIAIIDGPMERDLTRAFIEAIPSAKTISGPLAHVARELSCVAAVVAADNGIAHVAAAVDTPVVALFGLTNPRRCSPWGKDVTVVRPSSCPPCFEFGDPTFGCKLQLDFACLRDDLQPKDVIAALRSTLNARGRTNA